MNQLSHPAGNKSTSIIGYQLFMGLVFVDDFYDMCVGKTYRNLRETDVMINV